MSVRYRDKTSGEIYVPSEYGGKHPVVQEVNPLEDFGKFARIAHSARLTNVGETSKNVQSFEGLEEI